MPGRKGFPLLYDAIVRIEGFKSWRPADPKKPHLPWWHVFPKLNRVHAIGLPKGTRIVGRRPLPHAGVLLLSPVCDIFFGSSTR